MSANQALSEAQRMPTVPWDVITPNSDHVYTTHHDRNIVELEVGGLASYFYHFCDESLEGRTTMMRNLLKKIKPYLIVDYTRKVYFLDNGDGLPARIRPLQGEITRLNNDVSEDDYLPFKTAPPCLIS